MKRKTLICLLAALMVVCLILAVACKDDEEVIKGEFFWEISKSSGGISYGNSQKVMPEDIPESAETPSLMIHYYRKNANDYKSWGFWLWSEGADGQLFKIQYQDDVYGSVTIVKLSDIGVTSANGRVGIIARMQAGWTKDTEADRYIDLSAYTFENNYYHVYLYQGDGNLYKDIDSLTHGMTAAFVNGEQIAITTAANIKHIELLEGDTVIGKADTEQTKSIRFYFDGVNLPDITQVYTVKAVFMDDDYESSCAATVTALFETDSFAENFNYDGDLGAIYTKSATTFKVWSPISTKIVLNVYDQGVGGTATTYEMKKGERGVFEHTLSGDQEGKYYTYTVYNTSYPYGAEIVDPYAKSAGLNGKRGMVVDFSKTNPDGWDSVAAHNYDANELVVWETHVADVTSSATWGGSPELAKKFLGMIETGTKYQGYSTGFDHIVELGVNAVQLVPIFDQANDEANPEFNWGYNPLNYNVLEGSYSTNASDGYTRIREFKQLVQAFNKEGINIIMDVVYNHVNSAVGSNFDVLMPGYYYRYTASGDASNGSGCGNETASEHYMFRKFMIDSVSFWAKEYKLGGFRFDLMGLHDLETMNQLAAKLKEINPSIVIYGEPWTGGDSTLSTKLRAIQANGNSYKGYGQFNDQMRDGLIAGGMRAATEKGWITETVLAKLSVSQITAGFKGFTDAGVAINDLYKTVNYVTCHDNYTLKDRIRAAGITDAATIKSMAMLANSVVFTSNGVNFMLAGEEFLRSKQDNGAVGDQIHNSYNASYAVNALDYSLKVTNHDMFENYQKLIAFKRMFVKNFGLNSNAAVSASYKVEVLGNGSAFVITITESEGKVWKVVHANGAVLSAKTPVVVDFTGYELYLDTLNSNLTLSASTAIDEYQTIIAYKAA